MSEEPLRLCDFTQAEAWETGRVLTAKGVTHAQYDQIRHDGQYAQRVAFGIRHAHEGAPISSRLARFIMGPLNFFGPEEWRLVFGLDCYQQPGHPTYPVQADNFPWSAAELDGPCPFDPSRPKKETHFACFAPHGWSWDLLIRWIALGSWPELAHRSWETAPRIKLSIGAGRLKARRRSFYDEPPEERNAYSSEQSLQRITNSGSHLYAGAWHLLPRDDAISLKGVDQRVYAAEQQIEERLEPFAEQYRLANRCVKVLALCLARLLCQAAGERYVSPQLRCEKSLGVGLRLTDAETLELTDPYLIKPNEDCRLAVERLLPEWWPIGS